MQEPNQHYAQSNPSPPPAVPPDMGAAGAGLPTVPPQPSAPPMTGRGQAFVDWLRTPRAAGVAPGVWAFAHQPKPPEKDLVSDRKLIGGAVLWLLVGSLVWSVFWNGYIGTWWVLPLFWLTPDSWLQNGVAPAFLVAMWVYYALFTALLAIPFGRRGRWPEVWRRYVLAPLRRRRTAAAAPAQPEADPAEWPQVRAAGAGAVADRLAGEARAGLMNDVDYARVARAWQVVRAQPGRLDAFVESVRERGVAAFTHPSGARDVPVRVAVHDLVSGQVRIGRAVDEPRNPYEHRGVGIALDATVLGTGLLAVGPPGAGVTRGLVRPVVEALCLQALAGSAAVVVVTAAGAELGPADGFDVIVAPGDPNSPYDLDLYGGAADPDEAAAILAEALVGDAEPDTRRGATALAQLLGPFHAAHGRFPSVGELRELLDGSAAAYGALRAALDDAGAHGQVRELEARQRQAERPGDVAGVLADRVALLDRAAFAGSFGSPGDGAFSMRALDHPLRVRVDLPSRGHAEAARVLARLVLAQFTAAVTARQDRSLFACLVLDDAAHTITPDSVRGLQRLRSAHAGAVLTLHTLDDAPEQLRAALLGAVGCRAAFCGVTAWDGKRFAETWGTTWVEARDVTRAPDQSGGALRRAWRGIQRGVTGEAVTTESVTVRQVERERWSASDLAHAVPAGHLVVSLTATDGRHLPPLLVDLRN